MFRCNNGDGCDSFPYLWGSRAPPSLLMSFSSSKSRDFPNTGLVKSFLKPQLDKKECEQGVSEKGDVRSWCIAWRNQDPLHSKAKDKDLTSVGIDQSFSGPVADESQTQR